MKAARVLQLGNQIVSLSTVLLLTNCAHMNYQDRARTPLKPMVSVVREKSGSFDTPPRVLEGFRPEYPEPEGERREKGFVSIICTINEEGKAIDFAIESMTSPSFAVAAIQAIAKWKWAPAMKNGHPVKQKVRVPMHFNAL